MIRNLYISEKLIISLDKDKKIKGVLNKDRIFKDLDSKEIQFVRNNTSIMEELHKGEKLITSTDGTTITSTINENKGMAYSIPASIENLEFNLNAKRR